ncbi:MAG: cytochrome c oxidase subunit II [Verrucomicrobium sp.]|nr:cytochrome c oxidase subunit II [Verrucomicrobium sp.]
MPLFAEIRTTHIWGLPPAVTAGAHEIDALLLFIAGLTGAVFVLTQGIFFYSLYRYRRRDGVAARPTTGHLGAEIAWTLVTTLIFLGLFVWGEGLWKKLQTPPPDAGALQVEVMAEQYDWVIHYPETGRTLHNEMVVPVGRPVHLHLTSRDVIHSLYIPEFRLYQDLVPGRTIDWVSFTAERPGRFSISCSQLCGAGHELMQGHLRVLPQAEFDAWYKEAKR